MKCSLRRTAFLLIFLTAPLSAQDQATPGTPQPSATLRVIVTGLSSKDGHVMIALTRGRENYEDMRAEPFRGAKAGIRGTQAVAAFEDIPHGEYAVRLFHDENDNEELDTNFLGIPTEDYGFSNNANGTFGPPSYDEARFTVRDNKKTITISLD